MESTKYDKYFITELNTPKAGKLIPKGTSMFNMDRIPEIFPKANVTGDGVWFVKPHVMVDETHIHNFDEYLFFFGANPKEPEEFDGEVEFHIGEEWEVKRIMSRTIVYIPAGLVHCPLKFIKVNKPLCFFHIKIYPTDNNT